MVGRADHSLWGLDFAEVFRYNSNAGHHVPLGTAAIQEFSYDEKP
jgi:hypothetical protein